LASKQRRIKLHFIYRRKAVNYGIDKDSCFGLRLSLSSVIAKGVVFRLNRLGMTIRMIVHNWKNHRSEKD